MRTSACILLALPLLGCPSAEEEELVDPRFDNSVSAISCPDPDGLPFPTETGEFVDDASAGLGDERRPGYAGFDILGPVPDEVRVRGWMGHHVEWDSWGYEEEDVGIWGWTAARGWVEHGREATRTADSAGDYRLNVDGAALPADIFYGVLEGSGACSTHGIYAWPAGTQVVIADLDGTMTVGDAELFSWFDDEEYVPRMWTDADTLLQTWASKGFKVVYLTGRPHPLRGWTRSWMDDMEFPNGPLKTAPELLASFEAVQYKSGFVTEIQDELGWEVVAAYGNSSGDIDGYEEGGVPKEITFSIGPNSGIDGTVGVGDAGWTQHIADFVEPHRDAD
jgi:hypothetical protein